MTPDDYQKVKEIFNSVIEIEPEGRRAFLAERCDGDGELRNEVERLLASYDSEFMEQPAVSEVAELVVPGEFGNGRQIGRYTILRSIGKGGMGEVYLAEDSRLSRQVALKILPEDFAADSDRLNRFEQEAKAASALNHPNILTIFEFAEEDGSHFIVSEYVSGQTLRQKISGVALPVSESLDIAMQVAAALDAAHSSGIVHRDIKPENVMVRSDGLVKVLDFGLAKFTDDGFASEAEHEGSPTRKQLTTPGMILGTVQYMSPEQTRGQPTDARTDIWSLGCVMYEMLAGNPPFAGDNTADLIAEIVKESPAPLSHFDAEIPERLQEITAKCLEKNADDRYQTIKDLLLDLKRLKRLFDVDDVPEPSSPTIATNPGDRAISAPNMISTRKGPKDLTTVSSAEYLIWGIKAHRLTAIGITLFVLSLLGGTAFLVRQYWRDTRDTGLLDGLRPVRLASWKSGSGSPYTDYRASHNGTMIAYSSTQDGHNEAIYIKQAANGEEIRVTKDKWLNRSPVWSPDDQRIAYVSRRENKNGIYYCPSLGGPAVAIATPPDGTIFLRHWSKDGTSIFFELDGNLFSLEIASRVIRPITSLEQARGRSRHFSLSPNEDMVAYSDNRDGRFDIWMRPTAGGEARRLTNDKDEETNPRWHPNGDRVLFNVYLGDFTQIGLVHVDGGRKEQVTRGEGDYELIDVSKDGSRIFYSTWEKSSDVRSVDVESGETTDVTASIGSEFWTDVSPDGQSVLYQINPAPHLTIYIHESFFVVRSLTDQSIRFSMKGYNPRWLADSRNIAFLRWQFEDEKYNLWLVNIEDGRERKITIDGVSPPSTGVMPINRSDLTEFHFSPDGRQLAYLSPKKQGVRFVDVDTGENTSVTKNDVNASMRYYSPLWSPEGGLFAYVSMEPSAENSQKPVWKVWLAEKENHKEIFSTTESLQLRGWSASGRELYLLATDGPVTSGPLNARLLQLALNGEARVLFTLRNVLAATVRLSADKKRLVYTARINQKDDIWTAAIDGRDARQLTANSGSRTFFGSPAWSQDGKTIFFDVQEEIHTISMFENFK